MLGVLQIAESGENAIIVNPGALNEVDARLVTSAEATIRTSDCVVVSLEVPPAAAHHALLLGRQHGVRTVLNLSPVPERQVAQGLMSLADILVVNETEAIELTAGASDIEVAALQLASMAGRDVVITRGRHGAIVVDSGRVVAVPGIEVTVVDTSGAGDAFLCGLVASLSSGTDLAEAARVGCLAGALVVGGPGFVEALDRWDNCDDLAALRPITNS
jgi:ribokinase